MKPRQLAGKFDRALRSSLTFQGRKHDDGRSREGQSNCQRADEHIQVSIRG